MYCFMLQNEWIIKLFLQTRSETEMGPDTWDALFTTTELTQFRADFFGELREKVETGNIWVI